MLLNCWFYVSGDTGHGIKEWVEFLLGPKAAFPHLKILFPTAPVRKYTPLDGAVRMFLQLLYDF